MMLSMVAAGGRAGQGRQSRAGRQAGQSSGRAGRTILHKCFSINLGIVKDSYIITKFIKFTVMHWRGIIEQGKLLVGQNFYPLKSLKFPPQTGVLDEFFLEAS
jgi:hypothetical protein